MPPRLSKEEYLDEVEVLAKAVVSAAIAEGTFEVFRDGPETPLQQAITELARTVRYRHYPGDGCVDHE